MPKILTAGLMVLACASPLRADLHYTLHTEARPIAAVDPVNPMTAMVGDMLIRMMLPEGAADSTYWVSDKDIRVELTKANGIMPAGSILLRLADGRTVVMNPQDRTYWKLTLPEISPQILSGISEMNPQSGIVHTGQFETIAGVRAERLTTSLTVQLPVSRAGVTAPPGVPGSITMTSDSWRTDRYANYAALMKSIVGVMGLGALIPEGFMLKNVLRSSIMPGYEIETVVTSLTEEPSPAGAFDIPDDYKEVPAPMASGAAGF